MRILSVTVKPGSAIDRLANDVKKYNEHLLIDILPIHPKRESEEGFRKFEELANRADVIDFQYWKSAEILLKKYPRFLNKPKVLTHHNPYDIFAEDWSKYNAVVVNNKTIHEQLPNSILIPNAVDLNFFRFNQKYTDKKRVLMVAFRIEGKKGIREVAEVCNELGYKFILVGRVSRPEYFVQFADKARFKEGLSDEELLEEYYKATVLVCNSVDNFESGPLPVLEAMACGVPVLTRNVGLVPDLYNMENMVVRYGLPEDKEDLKNELKRLMESMDLREKIRHNAYRTVINYSAEKRAREYSKLWNRVYSNYPLISVIVATHNRKKQIIEIIKALNKQSYPNLEIVIADDNSTDGTEGAVKKMREGSGLPIKYLNTRYNGYGLAMARNMGAIEAEGEALVFLDSRLKPDIEAIANISRPILQHPTEKIWSFGNKSGNKQSFVENFSCIMRDKFINAGMFNERMDRYGGITQEVRTRFSGQGFKFSFVHNAIAKEMIPSRAKKTRVYDIYKSKLKLWKMQN